MSNGNHRARLIAELDAAIDEMFNAFQDALARHVVAGDLTLEAATDAIDAAAEHELAARVDAHRQLHHFLDTLTAQE